MADPTKINVPTRQGDMEKHELSSHEVKSVFGVKWRQGAYDDCLPVSPDVVLALVPNRSSLQSGHVYSVVPCDSRVVTQNCSPHVAHEVVTTNMLSGTSISESKWIPLAD